MPLTSLVEISERGKKVRTHSSQLAVSFVRGKDIDYITFSIGSMIMQEMGWIKGDSADVLYDPEDRLCIIRRSQKGRVITVVESGRGQMQIVLRKGMPYLDSYQKIDGFEIKDHELIFEMPKEVKTYEGRNARKL